MTADEWIGRASPAPPSDLAAAIAKTVEATRSSSASTGLQLVDATAELLPRVVQAGCEERSGAFDLLTLDALITYALEAGSSSADECERTAAAALAKLGDAARLISQAPRS